MTAESQKDKVQTIKAINTKENSILISDFKTDYRLILGDLREGNESATPLMATRTPELWNAHYGFRGVFPRASKYLQYKIIKSKLTINREFQMHMESILLAYSLPRRSEEAGYNYL